MFLCVFAFGFGQVTTIDFETAGDGYTPSTNIPGNGWEDIFDRSNFDMTIINNEDGYYWAVEDVTGTPTIDLDQIDVTGSAEFTFSIDWITHHYDDWDGNTAFRITYSLDGGAYQNLLSVRNICNCTNAPAAVDTDFDGIGECGPTTTLPSRITGTSDGCTVDSTRNQFETYTTAPIALAGNTTLDIRLSFFNFAQNDQGIYLDNIVVDVAVPSCIPTHSLTSFAPSEGPIGSVVSIIGDDFSNSTTVNFNGTAATDIIYLDTDGDGTIDKLLAEVPTGATTGNIVISEAGCTVTSPTLFTIVDESVTGCPTSNLSELIITELYDGSSSLGYIEIYNGTGATVNLSDYSIRRYGDADDLCAGFYTLYSFPASTPSINSNQVLYGKVFSPTEPADDATPNFTFDIDCSNTGGTSVDCLGNPWTKGINNNCGGFNEGDIIHLYKDISGVDTIIDVYEVNGSITNAGFTTLRNTNTAGPNTTSNPSDWTESNTESVADLGTFNYTGSSVSHPSASSPADVTGSCLNTASFTSNGTASVGGTLAYQWYFNDDSASGWTIVNSTNLPLTTVSGETTSTLTLDNGLYNYDNYQFYCLVTENGTCSTISNAAQLKLGTATWDGTYWIWNNGTAVDTAPTITTNVRLNSNFNTSIGGNQQSFSACNLIVNDVTLTIANGTYVEVENDLSVTGSNGTVTISSEGSFVQINDAGLVTATVPTNLSVTKRTAPSLFSYEYTYWSSPVVGETIGGALANSDANRRYWYNAQNYLDSTFEDMNDNTPQTGAGIDDIDDAAPFDWQAITNASTVMSFGVGYVASHDPIVFGSTPGCPGATCSISYIFTGLFNNGNATTVPIYRNDAERNDNNWNLIGNPYPSAIAVNGPNGFLTQNTAVIDGSVTGGLIDGAIFIWSQSTDSSATSNGNQNENFSQSDYAIINSMGSVAGGDANGDGTIDVADRPGEYIPSGQAFFVSMSDDTPVYDNLPTIKTTDIIFNNAMRVTGNNDLFFRNNPTLQDNKLWLNLTSDNGVASEILVGYVENASDDYDGMYYDAPRNGSINANSIIYTTIPGNNKRFAIQAKSANSISLDEVIPIGFYNAIEAPTIFNFSISQVEGEFMNNNTIYLIDYLENSIHDLSDSDYSFTSEIGEFNDRFEIVFTSEALSIDDNTISPNDIIISELSNGNVQIKVNNQLTIERVEILDLLGRRIYNLNGSNSIEVYNLSKLSSAAYIAKISLSNGQTISKKAVKQQ